MALLSDQNRKRAPSHPAYPEPNGAAEWCRGPATFGPGVFDLLTVCPAKDNVPSLGRINHFGEYCLRAVLDTVHLYRSRVPDSLGFQDRYRQAAYNVCPEVSATEVRQHERAGSADDLVIDPDVTAREPRIFQIRLEAKNGIQPGKP